MKVILDNRITGIKKEINLKEIPENGALYKNGIIHYSGLGDSIDDYDETPKDWIIIVRELTFFENLFKKLKILNYF